MKRILLTGAGGSAGVNFVKSLRMPSAGGEKFYVVGTDTSKEHLELANADKKYQFVGVTNPSYIDTLNGLIDKEMIELVHPQPDVEVDLISERRDDVHAIVFLPAKRTIRVCQDKMACNDILKKSGISVPRAYNVKNEAELERAFEELQSGGEKLWMRAIRGAGSRAALPVKKVEHAKMWIDYWIDMKGLHHEDFMISEFLPGKEFAFQSIWKDGELVTSQARERVEYLFGNITPSGQTSTPSIARTVHREDVNEMATKAILSIDSGATGIFCVDIKENSEGVPCLTEINAGRFFTTSNFFSEAGVNMPYLYVKLAYGESIPEVKRYNPIPAGVYWIRLMDCGHKMVRDGDWSSLTIDTLKK